MVAETIESETVLVHLRTDRIFRLNRTGSRVWQLLETESTTTQIESRLAQEFEVEPRELRADINALLDELAGAGLAIQQ